MKWFINLGLRKKFMLVFITSLFFLMLTGFLGINKTRESNAIIDEINEKNVPSLNYLLQADRDLFQLLTAERSLIFISPTAPEFNKILADYEENLKQSAERLDKYKALITGWHDDALTLLTQYEKLRKEWEPVSRQVITELKKAPSTADAVPAEGQDPAPAPSAHTLSTAGKLSLDQAKIKFDAMRSVIDKLEELHEMLAVEHHAIAENQSKMFFILISVLSLISILFALFAWFSLNSAISRTVDRMIVHARDLVEGEGDLTRRIAIISKDEIGVLGNWINRFIERIEQIINNTKHTTALLTASAEDVTSGSESLAAQTNEQAASVTETSTTIEEFSTILKQNSKNSDETNEMLKDFNQEVQQRKELIENVTNTMQEIYESSKRIDAIVNVINDISFQTNLLALNAAVEAARAGDAGRGFAVVAAEVRNLAQKTAESSKSIQEIVSQNVQSTSKGTNLVKQTSEFFETILQVLGEISGKVQGIAVGSREQANGVEQINQTISQLDEVISQNAKLVDKFANASKNLKANSYELKEIVDAYKTSDVSTPRKTSAQKLSPDKSIFKKNPSNQPEPATKKTESEKKQDPPRKPASAKVSTTAISSTKSKTTPAPAKPEPKKPTPAAPVREKEEKMKPTPRKPTEEVDFFSSDEENFEEF